MAGIIPLSVLKPNCNAVIRRIDEHNLNGVANDRLIKLGILPDTEVRVVLGCLGNMELKINDAFLVGMSRRKIARHIYVEPLTNDVFTTVKKQPKIKLIGKFLKQIFVGI